LAEMVSHSTALALVLVPKGPRAVYPMVYWDAVSPSMALL